LRQSRRFWLDVALAEELGARVLFLNQPYQPDKTAKPRVPEKGAGFFVVSANAIAIARAIAIANAIARAFARAIANARAEAIAIAIANARARARAFARAIANARAEAIAIAIAIARAIAIAIAIARAVYQCFFMLIKRHGL
jgi:hypothetical protein